MSLLILDCAQQQTEAGGNGYWACQHVEWCSKLKQGATVIGLANTLNGVENASGQRGRVR